ncbi:unnamed protein product [Adineta steineri]|uniref:DRBM domain-containing protein n=1 Tax=Adineta steineri TaxID=433720 RepID=A0A814AHH6_9BILA|nr:unnamed protein product [Adineta steineri]CAF3783316.1 unnamed protein product [Adineta steineri]
MNLPETLSSSLSIKSDNNEPSIPLLPTPTPLPSNMGVIHDKPITDLALKTPISFLQEICFRIHATPTYSLCPSEAQCTSSEPTFLYRVLVDDMIAFGKGSSKKRAKHKAAWVMIEQCYAKLKLASDPLIKTIEQYFLLKPLQTSHTNDDSITNGEKSNPIGKLQELTQKNWIRPPEYEFSDQENVSTPNTKMYSCHAKVATYIAEGTGLSKKIAKRQAATNLLNILENLGPEEKKALLNRAEGQNDLEQSHSKFRRSRRKPNDPNLLDTSGLRGTGSARSNRVYDKTSFQLLKNSDLPYINKLLSDDYHEESARPYEMFESLAQEQNFTFEFIQLPTIDEGSIQLLLEVRLTPVSVFHGYGKTLELARQHSTNLALKYIRCLSKQQQQQQHSSSIITTTPLMQSTA